MNELLKYEIKDIGTNVKIGKYCDIEENVVIGDNTIIHSRVTINSDVVIGNNVIIHPNVVINSGVKIMDGVEVFPGAYIGKEPKGAGALARPLNFEKKVIIKENSSIGPNSVIFCDVEIGNNTLIGDGASIRENCKVGSYCIISRYVTINYNSTIGDRTKIMDCTHITGNCIIGKDVFISVNVSTVNDNNMGKYGYNEDEIKGPHIEDGATVGAGAVILPNIHIKRNAIIGAGSVVTKNVNENSKVMGIPAKEKTQTIK